MARENSRIVGRNRLLMVALGLIGAAVALSACDGDILNGPCCSASAEADFALEADATGRDRFRLEGINGTIQVVGAPNTETVVIQGTRRVEANGQDEADASLEELAVDLAETSSEVVVRTIQPSDSQNRNFIVDYQIAVPLRLFVVIANVNGNITVQAIEGGVRLANTNGNVTLDDIVGEADLSLVNGNIEAEVTPPADGEIDITNVNGNIVLRIPADVSAVLEATLTNGSFTVSNLTIENQTMTSTSLTGTLGAGEGQIDVRTVNGNIEIRGF